MKLTALVRAECCIYVYSDFFTLLLKNYSSLDLRIGGFLYVALAGSFCLMTNELLVLDSLDWVIGYLKLAEVGRLPLLSCSFVAVRNFPGSEIRLSLPVVFGKFLTTTIESAVLGELVRSKENSATYLGSMFRSDPFYSRSLSFSLCY